MPTYEELVARAKAIYDADAKTRYYHNWNHIEDTLNALTTLSNHPQEINVVCHLALVFHDIIYIPRFGSNEVASAAMFSNFVSRTEIAQILGEDGIAEVKRIIENTTAENHVSPTWKPDNQMQAWVMDADLSGLATRLWQSFVFKQDCIIAEQLSSTTDEVEGRFTNYRKNCAEFLSKFLLKPRIYHSEEFKCLEDKTRENITAYILEFGTSP